MPVRASDPNLKHYTAADPLVVARCPRHLIRMATPRRRSCPVPMPDPGGTFSIGDLAQRTGTKATTIRWYEEVGLLPPAARTAGGHRTYGEAHLARLDFIRHAREFGFPLDAIRALLDLAGCPGQASCEVAHGIASARLAEVEDKLRRLEALRAELARMVETGCRGAPADCRILATLADHDHGHCLGPEHAMPVKD